MPMSIRNRDSLRLLALACFAVTFGLAGVSHVRGTLFGRIGPTHAIFVRSEYGKCVLHVHHSDRCDVPRWLAANWPCAAAGLSPGIRDWWRYGGFSCAIGGTTGGIPVRQVAIPYWPLVLISLLTWLLPRRVFGKIIPAAPLAA
jgi:hypothetical protein